MSWTKRKWTMRDGTRIWIKDMDDSHLLNTLRMLQRNAHYLRDQTEYEGFKMLNFLQGEMAIESVEQELRKDWTDYLPDIYDDLLRYARKRGFWDKERETEFNVSKIW